jgi:hypothetical protein
MAADTRNRPNGVTGLPEEVIEDLLASKRRRAVLSCLAEQDGPMVFADLAAAVWARGRTATPDEIDPETRRRVRAEIYEHDLPKLTATGVVEYDSMRGTVQLTDSDIAGELEKR